MKKWLRTLVGIGSITVGIGLAWRLYSRRHAMPCPPWLGWLLENPYMEAVAGSKTILDRLDLQPGMRLLDVGCGPGRVALPAAARVGPAGMVLALDLQPEMLRRLRRRMEARGVDNILLVNAGIGTGQLAQAYFDRAILVTVLGEIPRRRAALAEIFKALKPGGSLSVTEVIPDPHYQRRETVRRLASDVGFVEKKSFGSWLAFTVNFVKPEAR